MLTDCVPSKTLIATAELMTEMAGAAELGVTVARPRGRPRTTIGVDLARVNARVMKLAGQQSDDIAAHLERDGIRVVRGRGRLDGPDRVTVTQAGRRGGPRRRRHPARDRRLAPHVADRAARR